MHVSKTSASENRLLNVTPFKSGNIISTTKSYMFFLVSFCHMIILQTANQKDLTFIPKISNIS